MRERKFIYRFVVVPGVFAVGAACVAVAGCGGGMSAGAVAEVDGHVITKQDLNHWTAVQFATSYDPRAQNHVPSGVVPDPPRYNACIARLRRVLRSAKFTPPDTAKTPPVTATPVLRKKCDAELRRVREHMLNVLIVFNWYISEGERQGFHLSDAEIRREYVRFSREQFRPPESLQKYLRNTGESYGDELLRMEIDLLSTKLYDKGIKKVGGVKTPAQQQAFIRWGAGFPSTWKSRTSCRAGYVVQNCKEYKGSLRPDPRI